MAQTCNSVVPLLFEVLATLTRTSALWGQLEFSSSDPAAQLA